MTNKDIMDLPSTSKRLPLVTIAIPTFNRANSLRKAIDSALAQTYEAIEVVVSDNASTDSTLEILDSYGDSRFRYVRQKTNIGLIGNWNACLHHAKGDYYIILSDDDELVPSAIYDLVSKFYEDIRAVDLRPKTDVAFVYGQCRIDNKVTNAVHLSASAPLIEPTIEFQIATLRSKRVSYPSATLFRTKDAIHIGGYKSYFAASTDIGLAFEISSNYQFVCFTGMVTTHYNFYLQNFTSSINIKENIETLQRLAQQTLSAGLQHSWLTKCKIKKSGVYAQVNGIVHMLVQQYCSGSIEFKFVVSQLWFYRSKFSTFESFWVLIKGLVKVARNYLMCR